MEAALLLSVGLKELAPMSMPKAMAAATNKGKRTWNFEFFISSAIRKRLVYFKENRHSRTLTKLCKKRQNQQHFSLNLFRAGSVSFRLFPAVYKFLFPEALNPTFYAPNPTVSESRITRIFGFRGFFRKEVNALNEGRFDVFTGKPYRSCQNLTGLLGL